MLLNILTSWTCITTVASYFLCSNQNTTFSFWGPQTTKQKVWNDYGSEHAVVLNFRQNDYKN